MKNNPGATLMEIFAGEEERLEDIPYVLVMRTEYRGPTDRTGSRILVRANVCRTKVIAYNHAAHDAHHSAAVEFLRWMNWDYKIIGQSSHSKGRYFVATVRTTTGEKA
jgi:hypothetical protein